jgi:uncharacterized protein YutD
MIYCLFLCCYFVLQSLHQTSQYTPFSHHLLTHPFPHSD